MIQLLDEDGEPTWAGRTFSPVLRLSPDWYAVYPPARAAIENLFSSWKTRKGTNVVRGQHPAVGLSKVALFVAIALAVENRRRLINWLHPRPKTSPPELPDDLAVALYQDPLLNPDTVDPRPEVRW